MECMYCNKILSTIKTLIFHQQNTLYCLRIQKKLQLSSAPQGSGELRSPAPYGQLIVPIKNKYNIK